MVLNDVSRLTGGIVTDLPREKGTRLRNERREKKKKEKKGKKKKKKKREEKRKEINKQKKRKSEAEWCSILFRSDAMLRL